MFRKERASGSITVKIVMSVRCAATTDAGSVLTENPVNAGGENDPAITHMVLSQEGKLFKNKWL
ncbi:MAG: hypothetical protein WC770_09700 [Phycisphaerae bacterium]|jgi:hypothetical protein